MKLDEIVAWYQKKIGTYDKQQWEKTVEQNILDGLSSVQLKTAKLKPELIDVDLVRGSTFQKAKPKQSLFTVIRFAILRYFFLPLYAQWWVKQTSPNAFAILLSLYLLQMINWGVYTLNVQKLDVNTTTNTVQAENITGTNVGTSREHARINVEDNIISLSELLIPMCISLLLSLIHSQIVATNSVTGTNKCKHRHFPNATNNKVSREQRIRRRKKLIRLRSHDSTDTSAQQQQQTPEIIRKATPIQTSGDNSTVTMKTSTPQTIQKQIEKTPDMEIFPFSTVTIKNATKLQLDLQHAVNNYSKNPESATEIRTEMSPKKRNVNWHSPIHKYESEMLEKQQQTSPQSMSSSSSSLACNIITTTTSETNTPQHIEQPVNIPSVRVEPIMRPVEIAAGPLRRHFGEDDGFESLNGKSSSGEENVIMQAIPCVQVGGVSNSQLRQRLKAVATNNNNHENDITNNAVNYKRNNKLGRQNKTSSSELDEDGDYETELIPSPVTLNNTSLNYNECTTSATEWLGVTTNSEECSYSSEYEQSECYKGVQFSDGDTCDADFTPALLLNSHGVIDRISCTIWEHREIKKAQLSVLQISSCILERVESMPETNDYVYLGICFAFLISLFPCLCRLFETALETMDNVNDINLFDVPKLILEKTSFSCGNLLRFAFGTVPWQRTVLIIAYLQRFCLSLLLFIIFAVAERTFKQRFLYAKLFSHLTSSRRARKSNLPHFRLNKVRNIKTWLSVRSYLKKRGPQRSVNVIVTAAFIVTLLLLAFLSVEWLKDSVQLHSQLNLEALLWATFIGIYLLRFMTLGNKIHDKYRSMSVLITEQINLYLQIEQKPKKKEELMVANSVLKLASDLLKELETPFKISGLCANPYLFTTIKVVILSALSGVLSEMLGFKLKLHKIKIK